MTIKTLSLSHFVKRIPRERTKTRFTWLIGAGMSETAGIPIAVDISLRIIIFEYLLAEEFIPWGDAPDDFLTYNEKHLDRFFDWYDESEANDDYQFQSMRRDALQWLREEHEIFSGIAIESPECYQLLFHELLHDPTIHHVFLTRLVSRARGLNLAHLALAGVLRDHPNWGHTVFTTNFDDLLIKAILTLNHTARTFGDVDSSDKPSTTPTYPQIVHLHGRHTGYSLLNTGEQIQLINPEMQTSFRSHLAESHLIVIGYSGWDDLVMRTLADWPNYPNLLKGNLYWVPHIDQSTLLPQTLNFLQNAPANRTFLIEADEDDKLDADAFMLAFARSINQRHGGFVPYRQDVINHARQQHDFIMTQLSQYPQYHPRFALELIEGAIKSCEKTEFDKAEKDKKQAIQITNAEDLDDALKGEILLKIGIVEKHLGDLIAAEQHLDEARKYLDKRRHTDGNAHRLRLDALYQLAEVHLRRGNLNEAATWLNGAMTRYETISWNKGIADSYVLRAHMDMRMGRTRDVPSQLELALEYYREIKDEQGIATCHRMLGDYYRLTWNRKYGESELSKAVENYKEAIAKFSDLDNLYGLANSYKGLGDTQLLNANLELAESHFEQAIEIYNQIDYHLGIASIEQAHADLHAHKGDYEKAEDILRGVIGKYRDLSAAHMLANALGDLIALLCSGNKRDEAMLFVDEAIKMCRLTKNSYTWRILGLNNFINFKRDGRNP